MRGITIKMKQFSTNNPKTNILEQSTEKRGEIRSFFRERSYAKIEEKTTLSVNCLSPTVRSRGQIYDSTTGIVNELVSVTSNGFSSSL